MALLRHTSPPERGQGRNQWRRATCGEHSDFDATLSFEIRAHDEWTTRISTVHTTATPLCRDAAESGHEPCIQYRIVQMQQKFGLRALPAAVEVTIDRASLRGSIDQVVSSVTTYDPLLVL